MECFGCSSKEVHYTQNLMSSDTTGLRNEADSADQSLCVQKLAKKKLL